MKTSRLPLEQPEPLEPNELRRLLDNSAIADFLDRHEEAGTPNEFTITGLGDCKVSLGDLRALVRAIRKQL